MPKQKPATIDVNVDLWTVRFRINPNGSLTEIDVTAPRGLVVDKDYYRTKDEIVKQACTQGMRALAEAPQVVHAWQRRKDYCDDLFREDDD